MVAAVTAAAAASGPWDERRILDPNPSIRELLWASVVGEIVRVVIALMVVSTIAREWRVKSVELTFPKLRAFITESP